jgi:hypothetical protein
VVRWVDGEWVPEPEPESVVDRLDRLERGDYDWLYNDRPWDDDPREWR